MLNGKLSVEPTCFFCCFCSLHHHISLHREFIKFARFFQMTWRLVSGHVGDEEENMEPESDEDRMDTEQAVPSGSFMHGGNKRDGCVFCTMRVRLL